ncbi:hypothetical protein Bca52824_051058 [Brassica carinata]|uniref:ADP-ribosyl cyclase/cyclic ADP-ribose hydrolase n=1 Tax=Brassica carinata TaxID=52824 RepID=A0A8X7R276_BRACI|nr:hypothetical protein Bca52824_051058 [Brassica carinata]
MASSSSLSRSWLYHVFLSFRGIDVRKGFLSHVLKELKSKGIIPFIDNEIKRGESVGPVLVGAIRQSSVAIVLLSVNYASSSWCLDELVEIMKCREEDQRRVIPIFYEVDPSHVRKQTGDFEKSLMKPVWENKSDNEADLINKVASNITAVLGFTPSKDFDEFVGIGAQITEIKSKLILQSEQVKVIGVVGPPGIGKSTTARVLYNQLSPDFPFSTFLENIRKSFEKPCGNDYQLKLRLHKTLLSQILNQTNIEVHHLGVAREMLSDKKILVVLDDVDCLWQLEEIATQRGWFGPGSIIIITTENRKLLKALRLGTDHIHEMKFPTEEESLQIFCESAFGQKSPDNGFVRLAWEVTRLSGNLPLGLRVMGSYLRGMPMEYWINALPRLRSSLDREIESTLRFSYDSLTEKDKALFLHIACFFSCFYSTVESVKSCLETSDLEVSHGLQGWVKMHSLLQQMGREIVKKQSLEEPGKRQFLMDTTEIIELLDEDTDAGTVLGISFETSEREEIQISKSAFDGMNNLHLSIASSCGFEFLMASERDSRSLKSNESQKLDLSDCGSLKELTSSIGNATKLRVCNLSYFWDLKAPSSIGRLINLQELDLSHCFGLKEFNVCSSLEKLSGCSSLKELNLSNTDIEEMPSSISTWSCLYKLDMSECRNLKEFPNVPDSIEELVLSFTGIKEVPPWIENLFRSCKLIMEGCQRLKTISPNVSKLYNLEFLCLRNYDDRSGYDSPMSYEINIDDCLFEAVIEWGPDLKRSWTLQSDLDVHYIFPVCLPKKALTSPISLRFRGIGFETLPYCIRSPSGLSKLDVTECCELVELPQLPSRKLIQTSPCKYAILPGKKVHEHFTHQATSGSLTINLSPRPLPSSLRFKACILLSQDNINLEDHSDDIDDDEKYESPLTGVSCHFSGKQNGLTVGWGSNQLHHMPCLYPHNLHIFEDSICLNQDYPEAEETTFIELSFVFIFHYKALKTKNVWKVKKCGVRLLEEVVPHCILDKKEIEDEECMGINIEANNENTSGEDEEKEEEEEEDDDDDDDDDEEDEAATLAFLMKKVDINIEANNENASGEDEEKEEEDDDDEEEDEAATLAFLMKKMDINIEANNENASGEDEEKEEYDGEEDKGGGDGDGKGAEEDDYDYDYDYNYDYTYDYGYTYDYNYDYYYNY